MGWPALASMRHLHQARHQPQRKASAQQAGQPLAEEDAFMRAGLDLEDEAPGVPSGSSDGGWLWFMVAGFPIIASMVVYTALGYWLAVDPEAVLPPLPPPP